MALDVRSPEQELVQLSVSEVPEGWQAYLVGGEHRVSAVYAGGNDALRVTFDVVEQAPGASS